MYFCSFRVVINSEPQPLHEFDTTNSKPTLPTWKWNSIIWQVYNRFCTNARAQAHKQKSPKLSKLLLRLHKSSTVVEANQSMKAGDIGCLLNIWKMWAVMSKSLKGLNNYLCYLPRMILTLMEILPPLLAKSFRNYLLMSPSGRPNYFVAKDSYL